MAMAAEIPMVGALLVLDSDGRRIAAKYAGDRYETPEMQAEFERSIFSKTRGNQARSDPDIILLNKQVVVYMFATDVYFYVAGDQNENELILSSVLTAFYETMDAMLRGQIDRRSIMENLEIVLMAMDETVDNGMIMENDSAVMIASISNRDGGGGSGGSSGGGARGAMAAAAAAAQGGSASSATSSFASAFASATRSLLK